MRSMREIYEHLPPHIQQQVSDLMADPLYQRLASVALEWPPKHIILEHYLGLLHFKGNGNDRRNNIGKSLARHGVSKVQASIPKLFDQPQWEGRTLERPLLKEEVDPDRRRGKACTWIIDAETFLRYVVQADLGPACVIGGLCGVEAMAHQAMMGIIASQEPRPVNPDDLVRFRHDAAPSSPNWQLLYNQRQGVFAVMDLKQGATGRIKEFKRNGFKVCSYSYCLS